MNGPCHGYPCYPDGYAFWLLAFGASTGFAINFISIALVTRSRRDILLSAGWTIVTSVLLWIGLQPDRWHSIPRLIASGTEAQRAETGTGSVHDGPVAESETPTRPHHPPEGE